MLAEDETVYGAIAPEQVAAHGEEDGVTHLHFPREISFFRSAYQKEVAAQQPAAKTSGAKRRTYLAAHAMDRSFARILLRRSQ